MRAGAWGHHEAIDRAGELRFVIPAAAAKHLELSIRRAGRIGGSHFGIRREPILAPFPDVSVDVVKSQRAGQFLAGRMRGAVAVFSGPGVLFGLGLVIAKVEQIGRAGAAGEFPFCFGWQAVFPLGGEAASGPLAPGDLGAISRRVQETQLLDRTTEIIREIAGVLPHDGQIFLLRDLKLPEPEFLR